MAATGPGLDGPGEIFFGSGTADRVVIGKNRALVVDNTTNPPTVTVAGGVIGGDGNNPADGDAGADFLFGNGADGSVTVNAAAVLTEDMYYDNLTIGANGVLDPGGYRIFVKGALTVNGSIRSVGASAVGATGGVATPSGSLGGGQAGSDGGLPGNLGGGGVVYPNSLGGSGGLGAPEQNGGIENTAERPTPLNGGSKIINDINSMLIGRNLSGELLVGGSGGSGGGGDAGRGGGGGAGGRNIMVAAASVTFGPGGTIESRGGAGANGVDGGGGGGGGGGGAVILVYRTSPGFVKENCLLSVPGVSAGAAGAAEAGLTAAIKTISAGGADFLFGNGADGDLVIGFLPEEEGEEVLILESDMYYNNLAIGPTGFIYSAGFRIFVKNLLTFVAPIDDKFKPGIHFGAGLPSGGFIIGTAGGVGGAPGQPGGDAPLVANSLGGAGGTGSDSIGAAGQQGGISPPPDGLGGVKIMNNALSLISGRLPDGSKINGGSGGSGGGGGTVKGGDGGYGAGLLLVAAHTITGGGLIGAGGGEASGGEQPENEEGVAGGGGGGGGGGVVVLIYKHLVGFDTETQLAADGGKGVNGSEPGAPGRVIALKV